MVTSKTVGSAVLALVVVSFGAVGCSSASDSPKTLSEPETAAEIPVGATEMAFDPIEELGTPMSSIVDRRRLVIREEAAWTSFWDEFVGAIVPKPDAPAVDFSTHMVIAATMGQKTSGGYAISVEEVAEKDGTLYAAVQETTPGALCTNIAVMTAPAVAVTVSRHEGSVAFVDTELAMPCTP